MYFSVTFVLLTQELGNVWDWRKPYTGTASRHQLALAFALNSNPIRCNVKECNPIQHKYVIQCDR